MQSLAQIMKETTERYLNSLSTTPSPDAIESELLSEISDEIELANAVLPKGRKMKFPTSLPFPQVAQIVAHLYPVYRIPCAGNDADPEYDVLGIYQDAGDNKGIYITSEQTFRKIARQFNDGITQREFVEFMRVLSDKVDRKELCVDPDLIAVNNGIFNYKTKKLQDFTPDLVFLSKSHVNYAPNTVNPVLHNTDDGTDWDVESWMKEIADDDDIAKLLWEIIGAIIRPNVRWNKSAWFYSEKGENGKGTLCALMRNICGPGTHTSLKLADFSKDFALEPLISSTAIITDENNVGEFISKAAEIKTIITNDTIHVNRKFKTAITFRFRGFMVQCVNELPRMRDKSDSLYRRQLFVPFSKSFTGVAREYIKDDYIRRSEVLEYVLWRVLNMDYYKLSEPKACRELLLGYKEFNDPVRQFAGEMLPQLVWDFAPNAFLYDLYKAWFHENCPSGQIQGRNTFITDLRSILPSLTDWEYNGHIRPGRMMDKPEPLIAQYNLVNWMNKGYRGSDMDKICTPTLADAYGGFIRVNTVAGKQD